MDGSPSAVSGGRPREDDRRVLNSYCRQSSAGDDRLPVRKPPEIVDRGEDGSECRWARILAYEPPYRVVFSWDIGPTWQLESNPDLTSEVEVTFTAEAPDRTRVELEHRHIDRHGPGWESVRDGVADDQGRPLYLDRYAALFS